MQQYSKVQLRKKGKKTFMKVFYNQTEANKEGNSFDVKWSKESDQFLSKELDNAFNRLIPHLMFASELIDESIKLNREMDYEKWFKDFHYNDDARFNNVEITEVHFIGREALEAIKIKGHKITSKTDKPFKVKLETPVINLDRVKENRYALVSILDENIDDLQEKLDKWREGETLSKAQQMTMFKTQEEAA